MSMKTRDQIKEAFTKGKKLKSKWISTSQVNIYALDIFLQKSGYHLVDIITTENTPELVIEAIKEGYLHPEIIHDLSEGTFYIRVKNYGELTASDLEEVIKGYQTAISVVHHLEGLDLSKLEIEEE